MQFARHLRQRVASGEIDCSVRVWHRPRVKTAGRYQVQGGHIIVSSVREIALAEVTDSLAVRSGFADAADLLATARHGGGENIYLVKFQFEAAQQQP